MSDEDIKLVWTTAYLAIIAGLCSTMEDKVTALWLMFIAIVCWFVIIDIGIDRMNTRINEREEIIEERKE